MIKKYEIINDGGKKRIKALRSFHVQGRYVNIGDVGGIVYDENTLSQEGNCWIFSGNLNYPSIRVGGDSIVDTNGYEADVTDPRPIVNITGASALIGAHEFVTGKTTAAKVLAVGDVEQGNVAAIIGSDYYASKVPSVNDIRLKSPIYVGGASVTVTLAGEGYEMRLLRYNAEKKLVSGSAYGNSANAEGVYYIGITIRKTPAAATVPADIAGAKVSIPPTAIEAYLDINDSRLEFQYTSAMTVATKVNAGNTTLIDVYKSVIDGSNLTISKTGAGAFVANILADVIKCNVRFSAVSNNSLLIGNFSNVSEIINGGSYSFEVSNATKNKINVRDCYTFAQSETVLPTTALSATPKNMPFTFIRCNVPDGRFYHNARMKNTYTDIDFSKASDDLAKTTANGLVLASSDVEGMYRIYAAPTSVFGGLVEARDSVMNATIQNLGTTYGTTIYKDAYFNGRFDFAGTNVFGNKVPGPPRAAELKARTGVVRGILDALANGRTVTGVVPSDIHVVTPIKYRINSAKGLSVKNLPTGIQARIVIVDERNVIMCSSDLSSTDIDFTAYAGFPYAYIIFSKIGDATITPDELGETTITVYNGCKIINTGTTAISMKGNIRVEDNATLVNASVTGSGYFGGDSVVYYNPTVWASLDFVGTVYMKDKAVFAPTALTGACALVRMEGNAKFIGSVDVASTNLSFIMRDNAVIEGKANTRSGVVMSGNSKVAAAGQIMAASRGVLVMEDNASIEANTTVIGAITLSGNYKGNAVKTWVGKRTITDVNSPEYDNNVKTQYDF